MAGSITDLANLDAYYDAVTGLPNRALLIDRLRGVLKRRLRQADYSPPCCWFPSPATP